MHRLDVVLVIAMFVLTSACTVSQDSESPPRVGGTPASERAAADPVLGDSLQFREVFKHSMSAAREPVAIVVTTQTQWAEAWRTHLPGENSLPTIDFSREVAIVVATGSRSRLAGLHARGVSIADDTLIVVAKLVGPGPGCVTPAADGTPLLIVAVERRATHARLSFSEEDGPPCADG